MSSLPTKAWQLPVRDGMSFLPQGTSAQPEADRDLRNSTFLLRNLDLSDGGAWNSLRLTSRRRRPTAGSGERVQHRWPCTAISCGGSDRCVRRLDGRVDYGPTQPERQAPEGRLPGQLCGAWSPSSERRRTCRVISPRAFHERQHLSGEFDFWFDGGTARIQTGYVEYQFADGARATVAAPVLALSVTIDFPNGCRVRVQQES